MLMERIERLEETIKYERDARDTNLRRQRSDWEREVRILREALSPFYKSEQDTRQRLIEIEDRVEGNYDDQVRLRDKVVAIDDASMDLEKRVDDVEISRTKRRKTSRQITSEGSMSNGHVLEDVRRMSSNPEVQSSVSSSRAISPKSRSTSAPEAEVPRSSGILNLVEMPRHLPHATPVQPISQPRTTLPTTGTSSLMREEARSSGFLALDLAARGKGHVLGGAPAETTHPLAKLQMSNLNGPPTYPRSDPALSPPRDMPIFPIAVVHGTARRGIRLSPPELSQRKRKFVADHMALDVLAEVSVNSPLRH